MKIQVDGMKPQEALACIIDLCAEDSTYMSDDALRDRVKGGLELVAEAFPEKKGNRVIRDREKIGRVLERLEGKVLLSYMFDLYLSGMGLGRLPGFGLAMCERVEGSTKVKRRFMVNPERDSIYGDLQ